MRFESISGLGDYWKPISDGKALGILLILFLTILLCCKRMLFTGTKDVFVNDTVWEAAFAFIAS